VAITLYNVFVTNFYLIRSGYFLLFVLNMFFTQFYAMLKRKNDPAYVKHGFIAMENRETFSQSVVSMKTFSDAAMKHILRKRNL